MGIFQTIVNKYKDAKQKSLNKKDFKQALLRAVNDGKITKEEIDELTEHISRKAQKVESTAKIDICRDPKDNIVLECAAAGKADFIVTGDKDLLALKSFRKIRIITPRKFLEIFS